MCVLPGTYDMQILYPIHVLIHVFKYFEVDVTKHKEIPEDTIQNMGIHGSITGKTTMHITVDSRLNSVSRFEYSILNNGLIKIRKAQSIWIEYSVIFGF